MDWYPLWNSLRIAAISCVLVFFLGIFAAYYAARLPRAVRYIRGKATTAAARMPPYQVMTNLMPYRASRIPKGRLAPNKSSRK